ILLRFLGFSALGYFVLVPMPYRYEIVLSPAVFIGIAAFVTSGLERSNTLLQPNGSAIAVASLCSLFLALSLPAVNVNVFASDPVPPIVQHVRAETDPSALVVGDINDYWWFRDYAGFYMNNFEYEPLTHFQSDSPDFWPRIPDVVYFTVYPGMPILPPQLAAWMQMQHFVLHDTFVTNGFTTRVWLRPGYHPAPVS
ncbi:MAG TPA: hypothetical protein VHD90_01680, partial [Phototrophicaceae bacterium]|nr:hypothetical protein [Phototrophicaceae bacterium]